MIYPISHSKITIANVVAHTHTHTPHFFYRCVLLVRFWTKRGVPVKGSAFNARWAPSTCYVVRRMRVLAVSARPGGGVPRKVRRHLTSVKCVREAPTAILPGLPPRGALGCVRPGSTVTTGTHSVRTAGKAGTSPSRTALYACLAPSRRRPWGRAAPSVSATRGSLAVLQVEEAQERPR